MKRAAFTLVELLLALSLLSILVVALVQLLDTSMTVWSSTENSRDRMEAGAAVIQMAADDLAAFESGPRGDLLSEWALFEVDGDGIKGLPYPRLRMIRAAAPAELSRLVPGATDLSGRQLLEICWVLLPPERAEDDQKNLGVLWRGERLVGDAATLGFFEPRFFTAADRPPPGALYEVTGGVLWLRFSFATSTSTVHDGWSLGSGLEDATSAWDAWTEPWRPNVEVHSWNERGAGVPDAIDHPILPRRVRVELELERPSELRRRARLVALVEAEATVIAVSDGARIPGPGSMILIDEEWLEVTSKNGDRISVVRGRRGTRPRQHAEDRIVHHGWRMVREIPIPMHREDWIKRSGR